MRQVSCGNVYATLTEAFRALCDDGYEFVPFAYAGPAPRHDAGFWRRPVGSGPCLAAATRPEGGALIWSL